MTAKRFLAIDMGAESSRAIAGTLENGRIVLTEVHRFPSRNVSVRGTMYWDILYIFGEIKEALRRYAAEFGSALDGIGIDTWGVDFGILSESGHLLQNPVQYRDHRTDGILEEAFRIMPRETLYARTGIQFMQFNSLFQLMAAQRTAPELLRTGKTFLMIPDLLHYFLSGVLRCEYTDASTTQMLDVHRRNWDPQVLEAFGIPRAIFPELVEPGTVLGPLCPELAEELGLGATPVIAPCTHDTASAVASVPVEGGAWAYLSCGTWSLLGTELTQPNVSPKAVAYNFTNEGGYGGTIRFLKNIMGLWVLQRARAAWENAGARYTYEQLAQWAQEAPPFVTVLDIDDPAFLNPDNMLEAIRAQCARTGEPYPESVGAMARAIVEGLALRYAVVLDQIEESIGGRIEVLHMVGGGIQNTLLCQFTSSAIGRPVLAGPVEATAMGNIAVQAIATGDLAGLAEARRCVARSCEVTRYEPRDGAAWQDAIGRLRAGAR